MSLTTSSLRRTLTTQLSSQGRRAPALRRAPCTLSTDRGSPGAAKAAQPFSSSAPAASSQAQTREDTATLAQNTSTSASSSQAASTSAASAPGAHAHPQPPSKYASLVGNTPLIDLSALSKNTNVRILAKAEFLNPSGSVKDRIARHILDSAEADGSLRPGDTVVASTSGNTGSAVALMCATRGYGYVVITNAKCSEEKRESMRAYGGRVIVADDGLPADHPNHYVNLEATMCAENEGHFPFDQYETQRNPEAYYQTMGPEIWAQTGGAVTHFVAGGSTGGTVSGTGRFLKERNADIKVLLPDPVGSVLMGAFHNGDKDNAPAMAGPLSASSYKTEGVGKDSVPGALDFGVVDAVMSVTDKEAFDMCKALSKREGVLAGGSSGLNVHAAVALSSRLDEGTIVTVLPDSGVKYLSKIYNSEWLQDNGFSSSCAADPQRDASAERDAETRVVDQLESVATRPMPPPLADRSEAARFVRSAAALLSEYAAAEHLHSGDGAAREAIATVPVIELRSPTELQKAFADAGCALPIGDDEAPLSHDALMAACSTALELSAKTHHPLFMNQLYAGVDPAGLVGDWLVACANSNVHTYEVAPVFTLAERECLAKMTRMWLGTAKGAATPSHDGLFSPGGSIANMYGMLLARHRKCPDLADKGACSQPRLVAFCSDQAHYSFAKAAAVTGLGRDNMVGVKSNADGEIIPEALEAAVAEAKAEGGVPFFVGATAGTTVLGAFDPFAAIRESCDAHDMWMHVDGAWGGAALLSPRLRERHLAGVESADSLTWNPHKQMNMPLTCSVFLTKHEGVLSSMNSQAAEYLFQPDKLHGDMDLGDRTIQCGRRADAFKLWLAWKSKGDAHWCTETEHAYDQAEELEKLIRASDGRFVMAARRSCSNVCFWYVPPRLRNDLRLHALVDGDASDPASGVSLAGVPQALRDDLDSVAPKLKAQMQANGDALIGFQRNKGMPNFFRLVLAGAKGIDAGVMADMLDRMDAIGQDY